MGKRLAFDDSKRDFYYLSIQNCAAKLRSGTVDHTHHKMSSLMPPFALVTGAADRIGKASALTLADMGYDIFLHYHSSAQKAEETCRLIEKQGQTCMLKQADFEHEEQVQSLIADCRKDGKIEILVNNASNFVESNMQTEGHELLDKLFKTNLKAPYILTKQFAKHAKQGLIINLLDTKINRNTTRHLDYILTKKSLEDFTSLSATQLAPEIRVNGIAPGLVLAPEGKSENYLQELAKDIPLEQSGSLDQLKQTLRFLVSNAFITGEVIHVDGGEHL